MTFTIAFQDKNGILRFSNLISDLHPKAELCFAAETRSRSPLQTRIKLASNVEKKLLNVTQGLAELFDTNVPDWQ